MPAPFAAGAALLSKELGKRLLRKKLLEAGTTGTAAAGLGVGAAGVGEMLANKPKKREESKMGSDKNVSVGKGRGTVPLPELTPAPRQPRRTKEQPRTFKTEAVDIPVSPMMPTAGIAGLAGGPSGAAAERMPVGRETYFGPSEETVMPAPRMRRGLFGEEIPEDEYQEMERKNKEAGFYSRFKKGGSVKKKAKNYASGGSVSSASKRADGCCQKGKTKGRMV